MTRAAWRTGLRIIPMLAVSVVIACAPAAQPRVDGNAVAVPQIDRALQARVEDAVRGFRGDVGVYVQHLGTGRAAAVRADEIFPTASMIKVPILVTVYDAVHRGALRMDTTLVYRDSLEYAGDDLVAKFRDSSKVALGKVAMLMITTSDNTGSLWLQGIVGGAAVNRWLSVHGFDSTRVNSRTPGREGDRAKFGWGQTTPREMARLLTMIRAGDAVSRGASEEMYRALTRIYWNGEALSQLPPWVQAASKQGAVDRSRSEVVLVNGPSGDYVFSVITRNAVDMSYAKSNEGYQLIRRVSALLWQEFEPRHPWRPDSAARRFKPGEELP
ncbi:MAG: serine hydrolase [Gemmatimonadota bacterium]